MSGLELLGALLGLYPIIVDLANTYKEVKGTGSAELSRDIMVAETMYNQTCIGLLQSAVSPEELRRLAPGQGRGTIDQTLWAAPEIQEKLLARLGPSRSALTLELLTNMCSLLEQVNTELTNVCRGTEMLDRVRTKVKMVLAMMPQSGLRERVKRIKKLNDDLRTVLNDRPFATPYHQYRLESAVAFTGVDHGGNRAKELFEAIRDAYTCTCGTAHVVGVGCSCAPCSQPFTGEHATIHTTSEWDYGLAIPVKHETPADTSVTTVLLESVPDSDGTATKLQDICAFTRQASTNSGSEAHEVLIDRPNGTRTYRMKVTIVDNTTSADTPSIKDFAELIQSSDGFSTKERLELALRLSLAIVQLCQTPWVSETWTRNDVCVKDRVIFILREMHSVAIDTDAVSVMTAVGAPPPSEVLDGEPILTKLGLALIELAIGKPIEQMKEDYHVSALDDNLANIYTAKMLLRDGKIRDEWSVTYEKAVEACIDRRYVDKDGNAKSLLSKHSSFISSFREAIILPLLAVWRWYEV